MSIVMGMQNFIKIHQKVQGIGQVSLFSELESHWLNLVNINVYANIITIFFTVLEIGPFSLFRNLELGQASTNDKCHFAIP